MRQPGTSRWAMLRRERLAKGLCMDCGLRPPDEGFKCCAGCREVNKQKCLAKQQKKADAGRCTRCGDKPTPGQRLCKICQKQLNARKHDLNGHRKCHRCPADALPGYRVCEVCRQRGANEAVRFAKSRKLRVFAHYSQGSMLCKCCGEWRPEMLTLDHINGGGKQHRDEIGPGLQRLCRWIEKNSYPVGFQVLCFNCNCGREVNGGVCPHKQKTDIRQLLLF